MILPQAVQTNPQTGVRQIIAIPIQTTSAAAGGAVVAGGGVTVASTAAQAILQQAGKISVGSLGEQRKKHFYWMFPPHPR